MNTQGDPYEIAYMDVTSIESQTPGLASGFPIYRYRTAI